MEKVAAGLQPRFRFKAACWRKREGSCSGSGRLLEVCDCNCVCVIVSLCDCVCLYLCDCVCVIVWLCDCVLGVGGSSSGGNEEDLAPMVRLHSICRSGSVSEDCIKSVQRLCSVSPKKLSPNSVFCIWILCTFMKIVLKVSTDCVLCPKKTFSEYCVRVRRLCWTQFVGLSVSEDCVAPLGRLPGPATPLTLTWPQTPNGTQFFWHWPQKRGAYITRLSGQIIWFNSHCVKKNFYYAPIQLWTMELWTQLLWDSNQW